MYPPPQANYQFSDDPPTRCRQVLTMHRVINFALFMGPLIILGVFTFLVYGMMGAVMAGGLPALIPGLPLLTSVGIIVALAAGTAAYLVPQAIVAAGLRQLAPAQGPVPDRRGEDEGDLAWTRSVPKELLFPLLNLYQTHRLTRLALLEGAAVLNAVFFFLEGEPLGLAVTATLIALVALQFPTVAALSRWLKESLDRVSSNSPAG